MLFGPIALFGLSAAVACTPASSSKTSAMQRHFTETALDCSLRRIAEQLECRIYRRRQGGAECAGDEKGV